MLVKLGLGPDIDAARRVVENDRVGPLGKAASDQNLLLIATGQRCDLVTLDAELDQQVPGLALENGVQGFEVDQAQHAAAFLLRIKRHDHVFKDRQAGENPLALAIA